VTGIQLQRTINKHQAFQGIPHFQVCPGQFVVGVGIIRLKPKGSLKVAGCEIKIGDIGVYVICIRINRLFHLCPSDNGSNAAAIH
jgi:hypothetical protein